MFSFLEMLAGVLKDKFSFNFTNAFEAGAGIGMISGVMFGIMLGLKLDLSFALACGLGASLYLFVAEKTIDSRLGLFIGFISVFSLFIYFGHLLANHSLTWLLIGMSTFVALIFLTEWIFGDLVNKGVVKA